MLIRFLDRCLDTGSRELSGPDGSVPLRPQVFRVLRLLIDRAPKVVSKEELIAEVWNGMAVSDSAIAGVIRELRAVLGDDSADPRLIATRHRQGYQWIAEVERLPATAAGPDREETGAPADRARPEPVGRRWLAAAAVVVMASTGLIAVVGRGARVPEDGWPREPAARARLELGLAAARNLESARALEHLAQLEGDWTPRMELLRARLLLRLARRSEAGELLSALEARRANLRRADQLLLDAVTLEHADRPKAASQVYSVLSRMAPDDVDYALAWWELDLKADGPWVDDLVASEEIPIERRLLLATRREGRHGSLEDQVPRADAAVLAAEGSAPVVAAVARALRSRAAADLGWPDDSFAGGARATAELLAQGEVDRAFNVWQSVLLRADNQQRGAEIRESLADLSRELEGLDAPYYRARLAYARGRLLVKQGREEEALEVFDEAVATFREVGSERVPFVRRAQAGALMRLGRLEDAERVLVDALREVGSEAVPGTLATLHNTLASVAVRRGRFDNALASYERALEGFRASQNAHAEVTVLNNLAFMKLAQGKLDHAIEIHRQVGRRAEELDNQVQGGRSLYQMALIELRRGHLDDVLRLADDGLEKVRDRPVPGIRAELWMVKADAHRRRAELEEAEECLRRAEAENPTRIGRIALAIERARLAREADGPRRAREIVQDALAGIGDYAPGPLAIELRLEALRIELDLGSPVAAELAGLELADHARRETQPAYERDARRMLAEALLAQGKLAASQEQLDRAVALRRAQPDFVASLEAALLQAGLDASAGAPAAVTAIGASRPDDGRERLVRVLDAALGAGHDLLAFEARIERARRGLESREQVAELSAELRRRGLVRLMARLRAAARNAPGASPHEEVLEGGARAVALRLSPQGSNLP